jgi:hypothetical protein
MDLVKLTTGPTGVAGEPLLGFNEARSERRWFGRGKSEYDGA